MKGTRVLAVVVALLFSRHAHAWNDQGHMMVASVAWEQLTDAAKSRVAALLKFNSMYPTWTNGVADEDRDEIAFVRAATWPDFIKKKDAGYTNDGEEPPPGAAARQNIGYSDKLQHRYWHFIDTPFSTDGTRLVEASAPNAETQIIAFRDALNSETSSDDLRSYDLVWLEHLVGDVHQPLHATSRFSKDLPQGDRGGNLVALCERPCLHELHAFWDEVLGTSESAIAAIKAAAKLDDAPTSSGAINDPHVWILESFSIAKSMVYAGPIGQGGGPFTLDDDYKETAQTIAEERVALAGVRLANLINASLR
jgi:hypothetical protein